MPISDSGSRTYDICHGYFTQGFNRSSKKPLKQLARDPLAISLRIRHPYHDRLRNVINFGGTVDFDRERSSPLLLVLILDIPGVFHTARREAARANNPTQTLETAVFQHRHEENSLSSNHIASPCIKIIQR